MNARQRVCLLIGALVAALVVAVVGLAWPISVAPVHLHDETGRIAEGPRPPWASGVSSDIPRMWIYTGTVTWSCGAALLGTSFDSAHQVPEYHDPGFMVPDPCGPARRTVRDWLLVVVCGIAAVTAAVFLVLRTRRSDVAEPSATRPISS